MTAPAEPPERTLICSVVFLDIVGYSKEVVSQQMIWKRALNALMSNAIASLPQSERVILDTGDGAALCFLSDPEIALIVALQLLDGFRGSGAAMSPPMLVRMGVNMGSVKLVRDINDQPNVVGEAINVAQRIMSFANANQILASRSFFEVVGCLTHQYHRLFAYHGSHDDKHKRTHEVFEIKPELLLQQDAESAGIPVELGVVPSASDGKVCEVVLAPEILTQLEALMSAYIGPMAAVLVKKSVKSVPNLFELCGSLAEQIHRTEERDAFLRKASGILSNQGQPSGSPRSAPDSKSAGTQLEAAAVEILESELAQVMGPIAKVSVRKEAKTGASLPEVIQKLGLLIPSEAQRQTFTARTLARIAKLPVK